LAATGLYLASFAGIFLELMLIRYLGSEIPVLAYFKNFPLLAAFAGLGAGCLMADRRLKYVSGIASLGVVLLLVAAAGRFGWDMMSFPEPKLDVWGRFLDANTLKAVSQNAGNLAVLFAILAASAWSFVWIGQAVGRRLREGSPLARYSVDILGSLSGVLAFAVLSFVQTPPLAWIIVSVALLVPAAILAGAPPRRLIPVALAMLVAAGLATGRRIRPDAFTIWSPYYRIDVLPMQMSEKPPIINIVLAVNKDFHQVMLNLSDSIGMQLAPGSVGQSWWLNWRLQYDLPYYFRDAPRSVLIGGAGSGNDAAAAIRRRAGRVTAVEIDPAIIALGRDLHPERPYADITVRVVQADIRSFLKRSGDKYDLIVFGILDSHTALSALSSLRLDNYVYTVEGIRSALAHLTDDGVMCLSFHEGDRKWLGERLYRVIAAAAGRDPVALKYDERIYFVFGPGAPSAFVRARLKRMGMPEVDYSASRIREATDDWPFLYTAPGGQPWVYYLSLVLLAAGAAALVALASRRVTPGGAGEVQPAQLKVASITHENRYFDLDVPMFLLGAGFLLVETKSLAEMSLLFGSTWVVNTFVFAGIFVMVLFANLAVALGMGKHRTAAYVLLAVSLLAWYFFPRAALNSLEYWPRATVGTALAVLPMLFAGVVFSSLFAGHPRPDAAFGSNLMGAVVGGASEALSLAFGIRFLTLLALVFYIGAFLLSRNPAVRDAPVSPFPAG
jgi:hypothetical protein